MRLIKQGQQINADKRISLEAERAYLKKELAKLASAGQRAFAQPNYLAA